MRQFSSSESASRENDGGDVPFGGTNEAVETFRVEIGSLPCSHDLSLEASTYAVPDPVLTSLGRDSSIEDLSFEEDVDDGLL